MQIWNSLCRFVQIRKSTRICTLSAQLSARCLRAVCAVCALSAHCLQKSACLTCVHTCCQYRVVSTVLHVAAHILTCSKSIRHALEALGVHGVPKDPILYQDLSLVEHEKVGSRPVELPAPMSKRQRRGEPKPAKMTIEQWHASNDKLVGIEGQVYGKKGYCDGEDFHTGQIIERHTDHVVNVSGSIYYLGVAAPAREHEPGDVATPGAALRQAGMHECHRVADVECRPADGSEQQKITCLAPFFTASWPAKIAAKTSLRGGRNRPTESRLEGRRARLASCSFAVPLCVGERHAGCVARGWRRGWRRSWRRQRACSPMDRRVRRSRRLRSRWAPRPTSSRLEGRRARLAPCPCAEPLRVGARHAGCVARGWRRG